MSDLAAPFRALMKWAFTRPSDWRFDTSGGVGLAAGPISVTKGTLYAKWKDDPKRYELSYASVGASFGLSLPVGISFSSADAPGSGVGQIYYLTGTTSLVLKDFTGPFVMVGGRVNAGVGGSGNLVFLGNQGWKTSLAIHALLKAGNPAAAIAALAMFKGVGILWGTLAGSSGATIDLAQGHILSAG